MVYLCADGHIIEWIPFWFSNRTGTSKRQRRHCLGRKGKPHLCIVDDKVLTVCHSRVGVDSVTAAEAEHVADSGLPVKLPDGLPAPRC